MMNKFAFLGLILSSLYFCMPSLSAQTPSNLPKPFVEESSKEAKALMAELRTKHQNMKGMFVQYELTMENGDKSEKQTGELYQTGLKYRVTSGSNEMICDGKTVWTYTKKQNEVQVTDYEADEEDLLAPNKLLNFQQTEKQFYYEITGEDGNAIYLEFKPLDKKSEYSKLRLKIDKKTRNVGEIRVFTKNSTRYILNIKKMEDKTIPASNFAFNANSHPGVKVVDLRD